NPLSRFHHSLALAPLNRTRNAVLEGLTRSEREPMKRSRWISGWTCLLLSLAWAAMGAPARAQHGLVLSGGGAVNRSMGGSATAAPLDAIGALFWNPATLSGLKSSELSIGAEALFPHPKVESSLRPNSFGPGLPPVPL